MIKLLSVAIIAGLIFESNQLRIALPTPTPRSSCFTRWFDRDNPSGTGDFETLTDLHRENPGKICSNPLEIQVTTRHGLCASLTGDVFYKSDTTVGFICRNQDQPGRQRCQDYRVRFRCPVDFCQGCWTTWSDRDNPSGTGDWETLSNLHRENPGKICSNPVAIEVRTLAGFPPASTRNVIYKMDTTVGFVCRNRDQPRGRRCRDFKVRFRCPASFCEGCWTQYFDRDNPSGTGDWETLSDLRSANPGKICSNPVAIEARTLAGLSPASVRNVIYKMDTTVGFVCRKQDQSRGRRCRDYKVRFRCPADFCEGCQTQYFDRDNPSGTGDWETLYHLHRENPGKICSNPIGIEVKTLAGLSVAATTDVIYYSDTNVGFICKNRDQRWRRRCKDYKVRFHCPADFCHGCWTQYFDRDDPSGTGDWEILSSLRRANPGKICSNPVAIEAITLAGLSPAAAGNVIYRIDTTAGFICRNKDQRRGRRCSDYKVRFRCPASFCQGCQTQYFDRDDPTVTGDWETLSDLHRENPGKICSNPVGIEALTLAGLTPTAAGDVIYKSDTTVGFVCRIQDQPGNRLCKDYKVRFSCPTDFCGGCWTQYFDRDNPSGTGDWETLSDLRSANPGQICSNPVGIEARTLAGLSAAAAGNVIYKTDTIVGFVCRNEDQPGNKKCSDYKVRFRCPASFCQGCQTQYFDRDDPTVTGDWETLSDLHRENPGKICSNPVGIQALTLAGLTPMAAGDVIYLSDTTVGFVCRIQDQPGNRLCKDYKVRFSCPTDFCEGCWTQYFDRDNPSGTGDWETLSDLRNANPGKICSNPVGIEARTLAGLSAAAAGNVIYKTDTTVGFVCRNEDQPGNKKCSDYKVRFRCPASFCEGCQTQYFDRDDPTVTGDWETLSDLHRENPGKICSNPVGIQALTLAGLTPTAAGDVIYKSDTTVGFVCRIQDQPGNRLCKDYKVRFSCPTDFCEGCWTQYFDRDNPSGTGDWETLSDLRIENPGKICSNPVGIEARTLAGLSAAAAGDVIYRTDATVGFVCRNEDQPGNKKCSDYKVRFRCPASFCQGCQTQYFDRDDPTVTGDWETLSDLHRENPGKICSNPVGIQALTLAGLTPMAAGDVIYISDTTVGFVCRIQDQPGNRLCKDYKVRFSCPTDFCEGCWTQYFDRDNPSGTGDWETLSDLRNANPGKICSNPVGIEARTLAGLSAAAAGNVIYKTDTTVGFVCRNEDQPGNKKCSDYKVRFRCPASFCEGCQTQYFDRDDPTVTGDWETLSDLHRENPGKICSNPVGIQALTLAGLTPTAAGDVIYKSDTTVGFVCRIQDQPGNRLCKDYKVRFSCPTDFCEGCWTQYFDRDNPSGTGDWETLSDLRIENPGKICSNPVGIEARTLAGLSAAAAGNVIYRTDATVGFVCRNEDQPGNKKCSDYKVRFRCPASFCQGCQTQYFDRDDPTVTGDWETLSDLHRENPGKICSNPVGIQALTLAGLTPMAAGDVIYISDTTVGFVCRIQDQPGNRLCKDYKVRFSCPTDFCEGCWTQYFDRDNPSGTGDWETLSDLRNANPGKICSNPVGIEARTLAGLSAAAAGNVIYKTDTTVGFVCRNEDQPGNKKCSDYKVRFRCPASFCEGCQTQYFDRDDPTVTGDWETLSDLHRENPGKICSNPVGIQALTLAGLTPTAAGDVIYKSDTTVGFVCRIQDQPGNRLCKDYKVRFSCPTDFCEGCWTQYFDRDNPSGTGDWETLSDLRIENPGKICSNPVGIEARTLAGLSAAAAGNVIYRTDATVGFVCRNEDQPGNKKCSDYKVRFRCPASFCQGCQTQYFDRDDPTVTGDWETLSDLHRENPGKICSNPVGIQALTLAGLTPMAAGDVIYISDTTVGFVCRIQDQPGNRLCKDYKVRFSCPTDFCEGCWTQYFDRDNPSGTGDWETLSDLRNANPGKICSNPVGIEARTLAGLSAAAAGNVIYKTDTTVGFVCRNEDQPGNKKCSDYKVRFRCPASFCEGCQTQYFDRDDPTVTGDWETLSDLHRENPGKICSNPVGIQALTLAGLTPTAAGDVIYKSDTTVGFVCRIQDQPGNRLCKDYKVRFSCPTDFCEGCWTQYFDRDNPSGTGDWETLSNLRIENPGKICSNPVGIEARTLAGLSAAAAGNVIYKTDTTVGFVCRNEDQPGNKKCSDYKVRFRCPASFCQGCQTQYFDRDDPTVTGDWETLSNLHRENPGKICSNPVGIQALTLAGLTPMAAGDVIYISDTTVGFVCRIQDQPGNRLCKDYKVRFSCPTDFCEGCWTQYFDRDNPSGTGDWETLFDLHREDPGKICSNPVGIEARTLAGLSAAAAGNVIYRTDTTVGFVCKNEDQPGSKKCSDYKVRFRCPADFCEGCWTKYFDRDNPSGTGDWETLSNLRIENPGQICSNPVGIEVRTLAGLSPASAGNVIYRIDTTVGFVCRNEDQPGNKKCSDYKVRFRCPASFCEGCKTEYFDRDNPTGTGDWETLSDLHRENPGKICSNPAGIEVLTLAGLTPTAAGDVIYKSDTTVGFVCRIQDQPGNRLCKDYKVRFSCPTDFCEGCWTPYFDRDDPTVTGDWETLSDLHRENPGKICSNPVGIEARTLAGLSAAAAGDVIFKTDTTVGFVCRIEDQPGRRLCKDYKVRFRCPSDFCEGCWTQYFDRDNPSGTGDWETLSDLHRENPGKICSNPVGIEAITLAGLSAAAAGNVIYKTDTTVGFVCRNEDQSGNKKCSDYKVRFRCPASFCEGCWTQYFDRDNPSGTGDWETISDLRSANPGKICSNPVGIEALTLAGLSAAAAGNVIYKTDTTVGFVCRNEDQPGNKKCSDYKVRFRCPASFCEVCWTKWYDRDNPSGTGDWELLSNLRTQNPGQICTTPLRIEAVTTDTLTPAASTGQSIFIFTPTQGFVCRNRDQRSGSCRDYQVRFGCPC